MTIMKSGIDIIQDNYMHYRSGAVNYCEQMLSGIEFIGVENIVKVNFNFFVREENQITKIINLNNYPESVFSGETGSRMSNAFSELKLEFTDFDLGKPPFECICLKDINPAIVPTSFSFSISNKLAFFQNSDFYNDVFS